jgi:hypothetical protein
MAHAMKVLLLTNPLERKQQLGSWREGRGMDSFRVNPRIGKDRSIRLLKSAYRRYSTNPSMWMRSITSSSATSR